MYVIILEGENVPTNKFGWPDGGALSHQDIIYVPVGTHPCGGIRWEAYLNI